MSKLSNLGKGVVDFLSNGARAFVKPEVLPATVTTALVLGLVCGIQKKVCAVGEENVPSSGPAVAAALPITKIVSPLPPLGQPQRSDDSLTRSVEADAAVKNLEEACVVLMNSGLRPEKTYQALREMLTFVESKRLYVSILERLSQCPEVDVEQISQVLAIAARNGDQRVGAFLKEVLDHLCAEYISRQIVYYAKAAGDCLHPFPVRFMCVRRSITPSQEYPIARRSDETFGQCRQRISQELGFEDPSLIDQLADDHLIQGMMEAIETFELHQFDRRLQVILNSTTREGFELRWGMNKFDFVQHYFQILENKILLLEDGEHKDQLLAVLNRLGNQHIYLQ